MSPAEPPRGGKGTELILLHCAVLGAPVERRPPLERLEDELGAELARLLVTALSGEKGRGSVRVAAEARSG